MAVAAYPALFFDDLRLDFVLYFSREPSVRGPIGLAISLKGARLTTFLDRAHLFIALKEMDERTGTRELRFVFTEFPLKVPNPGTGLIEALQIDQLEQPP